MPQVKSEVALRFSESCALQRSLFFSADVILLPEASLQQTKNCMGNVEKAALQESGAFLQHFPANRLPRLAPADRRKAARNLFRADWLAMTRRFRGRTRHWKQQKVPQKEIFWPE